LRNDDGQTPAQRQAAAKLALRKQLEKTLLQVINLGLLLISICRILMHILLKQQLDSTTKTSAT